MHIVCGRIELEARASTYENLQCMLDVMNTAFLFMPKKRLLLQLAITFQLNILDSSFKYGKMRCGKHGHSIENEIHITMPKLFGNFLNYFASHVRNGIFFLKCTTEWTLLIERSFMIITRMYFIQLKWKNREMVNGFLLKLIEIRVNENTYGTWKIEFQRSN